MDLVKSGINWRAFQWPRGPEFQLEYTHPPGCEGHVKLFKILNEITNIAYSS